VCADRVYTDSATRLQGIASFYAARIEPRAEPRAEPRVGVTADAVEGMYDFNQVMGPDEYNYPVNNSKYTNAVAMLAIRAAIELAPLVGAKVPADYATKSVGLEIATSATPANSNLSGLYHPEYTGYPALKGPKVKQADTVMLSYPFGAARVFEQKFTLEDAIKFHAIAPPLETSKHVTNGIPLGSSLPLTVTVATVNYVETLKVLQWLQKHWSMI
jgi:hypothetical protein